MSERGWGDVRALPRVGVCVAHTHTAHTHTGHTHTGGLLFDRLEDTVRGNESLTERHAIATVCLKSRSLPEKPPPRIIVFTGKMRVCV